MARQRKIIACLSALLGIGSLPAGAAIMVDIDLSGATVTAAQADFQVSLLFAGAPTDQIEAYQLSIFGSDPLLTAGDTDFSRFSYTPANSPTPLDTWTSAGTISIAGTDLGFPINPAGPFITPPVTPIVLGVLSVDLSGLAPGTALRVTLAGGLPGLATDVGGTFGGTFAPSLAAAADPNLQLTFSDPSGVSFAVAGSTSDVIPEPASLMTWTALVVLAGGFLGWRRSRRAVW
jgi:hypothetical protein